MQNKKKGFIAILAAFIIPICTLIFYLNIQATKNSYTRIAFEDALKQAALDTARKYISGVSVANQQTYLDRIAAVSFNNAIKAKIGITSNLIPLTLSTVKYTTVKDEYFNDKNSDDTDNYWEWILHRYSRFSNTDYFPSTNIDPDADNVIDAGISENSSSGHILKRSTSGSLEPRKLYNKSTEHSSNTITVTNISTDTIKVEANAKINKKSYKKSYKATAPKLNADIVLGIPINVASMSTNNDPFGTAIWDHRYKQTPLWQIKTECRDFVKKLLSCRKCGIGLIPYGGNITLSVNNSIVESHGEYKYSNYDAVNPTIPISESYKFIGGENGIGISLNKPQSTTGVITQIMYRSDLESYLQEYLQNSTINTENIEGLIYEGVENGTKFKRSALDIVYGPNINILAGYSRYSWHNYPDPYPVHGLTEHPLDVYRYLALITPFRDQYQRSSFLYLPTMFGMSMLSSGWQKKSSYTGGTNRKKILILLVNQADLWQPREVTYFGFSNDASYVPMVDGDRIDYEKGGNLEYTGDGYHRNNIHYSASGYTAGTFLTEYDKVVAMKCNYIKDSTSGTHGFKLPKPGNVKIVVRAEPCMIIYKTNPHSPSVVVTDVKAVKSSDGSSGSVLEKDDHFQCYASHANTQFEITYSGSRESPVVAKTQMNGVEYDYSEKEVCTWTSFRKICSKVPNISSSNSVSMTLRQDENYVYICVSSRSNTTSNDTINISVSPISDSSQIKQYKAISYVDKQLIGTETSIANTNSDDLIYNICKPYEQDPRQHIIDKVITIKNAYRMKVLYNVKLKIEHSYPTHGEYAICGKETQGHLHYFIGSYFSSTRDTKTTYNGDGYTIFNRELELARKSTTPKKRCDKKRCKKNSQCSCSCDEHLSGNSADNFKIHYKLQYRGGVGDATKDIENYDDISEPCKIDSHQWSDYGYKHIVYIKASLKPKTFTDCVSFSNRKNGIVILQGHSCKDNTFSKCTHTLVVGSEGESKGIFTQMISGDTITVGDLNVKGDIEKDKERKYISPSQLSLSGNYNKSYTLNYGYNVIYIPRDQISANSGDDDSATISITLDKTKIISIEWSNHLNGTEGCYACSDSSGNDAKLSNGNKAVYYEPFKRSKNARWNSVSGKYSGGDYPFSGHSTIKVSTEENGWGRDPNDPDDPNNRHYLENSRTMRSYQYMEAKKVTSSYDYPRSDGTFTCIMENINRMPNLYAWTSDTSGNHGTEFNYMNCIGRYSDIFRTNFDYDPKTGYEDIRFCVNTEEQGYVARLGPVECTIDVNRVLMAAGYQKCNATDTNGELMNNGPTWCMRTKVTPKMITAFKNKFGNNGRIYVIHYRYDKNKSWSPDSWGVYKNYTASTQAELKKALSQIFADIKDFAGYENAKIVDE